MLPDLRIPRLQNDIVLTPGLLQKITKKCNGPEIFSGFVVFLGVFFTKKSEKIAKCNSPGMNTV